VSESVRCRGCQAESESECTSGDRVESHGWKSLKVIARGLEGARESE